MGVYAQGHRDVVDLGVGKKPLLVRLPGIEHLAPKGQDRLEFLVSAHLGRAARRIPLHQEELIALYVGRLTVGELSWQHRHARSLLLFHLLGRPHTALGCSNREIGDFTGRF